MARKYDHLFEDWRNNKQSGTQSAGASAQASTPGKYDHLFDSWRQDVDTRKQEKRSQLAPAATNYQNFLTDSNALIDDYNIYVGGEKWQSGNVGGTLSARRDKAQQGVDYWRDWYNSNRDALTAEEYASGMGQIDQLQSQLDMMPEGIAAATDYYGNFTEENYDTERQNTEYYAKYGAMTDAEIDAEVERLTTTGKGYKDRVLTEDESATRENDLKWQAANARAKANDLRTYYEQLPNKDAETLAEVERLEAEAAALEEQYQAALNAPYLYREEYNTNQAELDWLNANRSSVDYYRNSQKYGISPVNMKSYELLDYEANSEEEQQWIDQYIQEDAARYGYIGREDWEQVAEAERAYDNAPEHLSPVIDELASEYYLLLQITDPNTASAASVAFEEHLNAAAREAAVDANTLRGYVESVYPYVAKRQSETARAEAAEWAANNRTVATIGTYVTQPLANVQANMYLLGGAMGGTVNSSDPMLQDYMRNTAIRGRVGEEIGKGRFGEAGQWVYNAVNSTVDSAVNMLITRGVLKLAAPALSSLSGNQLKRATSVLQQGVSNIIMGSGASAQRFIQLKQDGYSDTQAVAAGMASGLIEGVTEAIGVDRWMNAIARGEGAVKEILRQGVSEGIEEVLSEEANSLVDWMLNDSNSSGFIRRAVGWVAGYEAAGYSSKEAMRMAFGEAAKQSASAFLAGMFSGMLHLGSSSAVQSAARTAGDYVYTRNLKRNAGELAAFNAVAESNNFSKVNASDNTRRVMGYVRRVADVANYNDTREATKQVGVMVREAMEQDGIKANDEVVAAITKSTVASVIESHRELNADEARFLALTSAQRKLLNDKDVHGIIKSLGTVAEQAEGETAQKRSRADEMRAVALAHASGYERALSDARRNATVAASKEAFDQGRNGDKAAFDKLLNNDEYAAVDKAILRKSYEAGEASNITATVEDGEIDVEGATTAGLTVIRQQYNALRDDDLKAEYHAAVAGAYFTGKYYGETRYAADQMAELYKEHGDIKAALKAVYDQAVAEGKQRTAAKPTALRSGEVRNISAEEAAQHGVSTVDTAKLTRQQKAEARVIRSLAKRMGFSVVFFDSKGGAKEGWHQGGTIYMDVNAGYVNDRSMLRTMGHELTHFIQQYNEAAYNELRDFITESYYDNKAEFERRVSELMQTQELDEGRAIDELVARGCEMMLKDSKAPQILYDRNADLYNTVSSHIRKWAEAIRKAVANLMKTVRPHSAEAKRLAGMTELANRLQELWDTGLVGAVENLQAQKSPTGDGEVVQYEVRDFAEQVDEVLAGKFPRGNAVYVGQTPEILAKIGLNGELPMLTTAKHLRDANAPKNTRLHHHGLNDRQLKSIPQKIADPVMLMDSLDVNSNSIVVVTDMLDEDKSPIVVSIKADGRGMYNDIEIDTNFVTGYYGRDGFKMFVRNNNSAGNILYINKKKAEDLSAESSTSWLEQLKNYDFDVIIRKSRVNVKQNSIRDSDYMTAVQNGDMETAQRMVDEAARSAGYDRKYYHGARKGGGFTVFRDWQYFTENEGYARRYMDRDKPSSLYAVYVKSERMFDTRKAKDRRVYEKYRMEQGLGGVQSDGLPDWTDGYSLSDIIDEEDLPYDGIVLNEGGDIVNGKVVSRGESYVIRKSNQVKSADPVTYDNNGNVIPLSQRFNESNDDIRYSTRDGYWKPNLAKAEWSLLNYTMANEAKTSPNYIDSDTKWLYNTSKGNKLFAIYSTVDADESTLLYASTGDLAEVELAELEAILEERNNVNRNTEAVDTWIDSVWVRRSRNSNNSNGASYTGEPRGNDRLDGRTSRRKPSAAFRTVLKNIETRGVRRLSEENARYSLRDEADLVAAEAAAESAVNQSNREILANAMETAAQTDLERQKIADYRKKIAKFNEQEQKLNELQQELTNLNAAEIKDGERIKDVRAEIKRTENRINTYDSQLLRLEAAKPLQDVLDRERAALNKKLEDAKAWRKEWRTREAAARTEGAQRLQDYRKKRNESDAVKKYRKRVESNVKSLIEMLVTNTDKKHVPEALKEPLSKFVEALDLMSKQVREGGDMTVRDRDYMERLNTLRAAMSKYVADSAEGKAEGYLDLPDGFYEVLNTNFNTPVYDMTAEELRLLDHVLTVLKTAVNQSNALATNANYARVSEAAEVTIDDLDELGTAKDMGKYIGAINKLLLWNNATPYYAFRRLGPAGASMFEAIQSGWDKLALNAQRVVKDSADIYTTEEVRDWSKEVLELDLSKERTVKMTVAQAMSIYCLAKRQQGLGHLLGGGIKIAPVDVGRGKRVVQYDNYTLTINDLQTIVGALSERQRQAADRLQDYMGTVGAEWGNEVSMKRFGYKAFGEANYFPIQSDPNNLNSLNVDAKSSDMFRLLNLSATKSLTKGANNAVVISNIFDVFAAHMSDMAKYNALALPILDMVKWYNYSQRTETGATSFNTRTVQKSLDKAFGVYVKGDNRSEGYAAEYIKQFIKDLNGVSEAGRDLGFVSTFMGRYKKAAVAANLRVAVQQPMSYARALAVMDAKYLAKGYAGSLGDAVQEMRQYSGMAAWKHMGFFDTNIGRDLAQQIKHDETLADRISDKTMFLAEKMDELTWGTLWKACKAETADKGYSGNELLEKTAERFREVVYATQVVDATTTRSHLMRSNSPINKMWTAFMSEPTLTYNMMLDSVLQWHYEKRRGNAPRWRNVGRNIAKAGAAYVVNAVMLAAVTAIIDAWRDDDDFETFWEKYLDKFGGNVLDEINPITKIVVVKDIFNIVVMGNKSDRMDIANLTQLRNFLDVVIEWYKVTFEGADPTATTYYGKMGRYGIVYEGLQVLSGFSGLPFASASREAVSLWNNTIGVLYPNLKAKTYKENPTAGYEKLYEAMVAGDQDEQRRIIGQLYGAGYDDEKINSAIKTEIKERYLNGELTDEEAADQLVAYCGYDAAGTGGDSINYQLDQWAFSVEGATFKMSYGLEQALATGDIEAVKDAAAWQMQRYGQDESKIASAISDYFKPLYINGTAEERRKIRAFMLATGYYESKALDKKLNEWLNPK